MNTYKYKNFPLCRTYKNWALRNFCVTLRTYNLAFPPTFVLKFYQQRVFSIVCTSASLIEVFEEFGYIHLLLIVICVIQFKKLFFCYWYFPRLNISASYSYIWWFYLNRHNTRLIQANQKQRSLYACKSYLICNTIFMSFIWQSGAR